MTINFVLEPRTFLRSEKHLVSKRDVYINTVCFFVLKKAEYLFNSAKYI